MLPFAAGLAIVIVESYLFGSIPFGVIVARIGYGGDPREGGSGGIGMTNMNRLFGFKAAALTFVGDAAKGAVAVLIARALLGSMACEGTIAHDAVLVCAVCASVLGHVFCPWLHFKGGKGISTGFGSILAAFPLVCLCILAVFAVFAAATKTVSAGSIAAAIGFPVFSCVLHWGSWVLIVAAVLVAAAVVFAHRGNIARLLAGTEPTFSLNTAGKRQRDDGGQH